MRFSFILAAVAPLLASAAPLLVTRQASGLDITVVKFANLLEQLETEFYTQALAKFVPQDFIAAGITVPDVAIQNFQDIKAHEAGHTAALKGLLDAIGGTPITSCTFDFSQVLTDVATMASVARVVELVGVGAYLGGASLITDGNILAAAATILTIEARHQTFLNIIAGATAIPQAQDVALTPFDVLAVAGAFVKGCDVFGELGLPSNASQVPLGIGNQGVVGPGTQLQFTLPAGSNIDLNSAHCQMIIGGDADEVARVFPAQQCVVPSDLNGPVWIWLTSDGQPLSSDIAKRDSTTIVAGPVGAFIDSKSEALGALVRSNGNGSNGFNSSETISPSQAQDQLNSASPTTLFATDAPIATVAPTNANAVITAAPTLATTAAVPAVSVIGVGQIPASSA